MRIYANVQMKPNPDKLLDDVLPILKVLGKIISSSKN